VVRIVPSGLLKRILSLFVVTHTEGSASPPTPSIVTKFEALLDMIEKAHDKLKRRTRIKQTMEYILAFRMTVAEEASYGPQSAAG
jgi:hypothetical protein